MIDHRLQSILARVLFSLFSVVSMQEIVLTVFGVFFQSELFKFDFGHCQKGHVIRALC